MARIKMVAVTMSEEQWNRLTQTAEQIPTIKTEVTELQDAVVELADILSGGDETDG